jgi:hypothetical protein
MKLSLRRIGGRNCILELTVETNNATLTEDVTNLFYLVDVDLINNLREIADELEEHNKEIELL